MSKLKDALEALLDKCEYNEQWVHHFVQQDNIQVLFDPENVSVYENNWDTTTKIYEGFKTINGHEIYLGWSCGDWETPVHLIYYLDKSDVLRMYVPKEGNIYNFDTNQAFGSAEESEYDFDKDEYITLNDDEKFLQGPNCPSWIDSSCNPEEGDIDHIDEQKSVDLMLAEFFKVCGPTL